MFSANRCYPLLKLDHAIMLKHFCNVINSATTDNKISTALCDWRGCNYRANIFTSLVVLCRFHESIMCFSTFYFLVFIYDFTLFAKRQANKFVHTHYNGPEKVYARLALHLWHKYCRNVLRNKIMHEM